MTHSIGRRQVKLWEKQRPALPCYIGIAFDLANEQVIERSPVERDNEEQAYDDAFELCKALGLDAEDAFIMDVTPGKPQAVIYDF